MLASFSSQLFAAGPAREPKIFDWNAPLSPRQQALIDAATELLETANVSYAMGGSKIGRPEDCDRCNVCLESKVPKPAARFKECPECRDCSLDCSHFTQLVFARAGMPHPYIHTPLMLELSAESLLRRYKFVDLGTRADLIQPGDLLVYKGHVVLVERVHPGKRGDVVHATGGRDLRLPGQGIQRDRFAQLTSFRGPLLRILRHKDLTQTRRPIP